MRLRKAQGLVVVCLVTAALLTAPPAAAAEQAPALVPAPTRWTAGSGKLEISERSRIVIDRRDRDRVTTGPTGQVLVGQRLGEVAGELRDDLAAATRLRLPVVELAEARAGDIQLVLTNSDRRLGVEGYNLTVDGKVTISAATTTGAYWATRTLLQLLRGGRAIPVGQVHDVPSLPIRAYMLDMARKYWQPSYVYDLIRQMSYLKLNVLNMHFADAEGFRLHSPRFPGLADPRTSYDQRQIARFVEFGRQHNVIIMPGFEMPGHATSVAEYFHIGLGDGPDPCPQSSVYDWVTTGWVMDMTKASTLRSVREMLATFVPWFSGPWVHIGADELPASVATCPRVAGYLRAHPEIGNLDNLSNTFLNDVDEFLNGMGKQTAVYSGFDPQATVKVHHDILVTDWTGAGSTLAGYPIVAEPGTAYLTPNGYHNLYPKTDSLYREWTPENDGGAATLGGAMSVWTDYLYWADDSYFEQLAALPRAVVAARTWNVRIPDDNLAAFEKRLSTVGNAPGYQGFRPQRSVHRWSFEPAVRPPGYVDAASPGNVLFFKDSTGGLHGSSYILGSPSKVAGVRGAAIHVDGPRQGISMGGTDIAGPWVLSFWVRRTADSATSTLLSSPAGHEIRLEQAGTASQVGLTTAGRSDSFGYATPLNTWTHLTMVSTGRTVTLYAGGQQIRTLDVAMPLPLAAFGSPAAFFHGDLDEVTITG